MEKNLHSKIQVSITPVNILHRVLYYIVWYCITHHLLENYGTLKAGDFVKYNWKAKVHIPSVCENEKGIRQIEKITRYSDGTEHCDFVPIEPGAYGGGCDTFWVRKLYWWEKH